MNRRSLSSDIPAVTDRQTDIDQKPTATNNQNNIMDAGNTDTDDYTGQQ